MLKESANGLWLVISQNVERSEGKQGTAAKEDEAHQPKLMNGATS